MDSAQSDDADIDAMLGKTFEQVGMSPTVIDASNRLNAMLDAARGEKPVLDPRTFAVRFTRLRAFYQSAAHYLAASQDDFFETLATRMGSGFHASLFANKPVVCYDGERRGLPWKRFEAAAYARDPFTVILNAREYHVHCGMVGAVQRHARAMSLLFDGTTTERTIRWSIGERACQATPDAYKTGTASRSVELKSTRCSEPRWFRREAIKRHYHCQLAWYDDGIETLGEGRPADSYIVAVENAAPFNVTIVHIPEELREKGARLNRLWFEELLVAEASGHYGPYVECDVELEDEFAARDEENEPFTLTVEGEELAL